MAAPFAATCLLVVDWDDDLVCQEIGSDALCNHHSLNCCDYDYDYDAGLANDYDFADDLLTDCDALTTHGHVFAAKDSVAGHDLRVLEEAA